MTIHIYQINRDPGKDFFENLFGELYTNNLGWHWNSKISYHIEQLQNNKYRLMVIASPEILLKVRKNLIDEKLI